MSFVIAHLSDAHIGPVPRPNLAELLGKRVTGYVNWLYKRADQHGMDVLSEIVSDLMNNHPDHVIMTGDIVNIGLAAELSLAKEWLSTLGPATAVSFTPGNHDAYVDQSTALIDTIFRPWISGDTPSHGFPYVRRRGDIGLIGLSSGVPTGPFIASGRLGSEQLAAMAALLDELRKEGRARVVFLHHPPHVGGARLLRGLEDAELFEKTIAQHGADLIVHGHNHKPSLAYLEGPMGPIPVVGVGSASARAAGHKPAASYHLYFFSMKDKNFEISMIRRGLNASGEVRELERRVISSNVPA